MICPSREMLSGEHNVLFVPPYFNALEAKASKVGRMLN
jgi:hypothetical protein